MLFIALPDSEHYLHKIISKPERMRQSVILYLRFA